MHLDTVITMCDRDLVTLFPQVIGGARTWAIRPGESAEDLVIEELIGPLPEHMAKALGVPKMRVVETGGDRFEAEREQWDDGNNVVALGARGRGRLRAQRRHQHGAAQGRRGSDHDPGLRARPRPRRLALHDLSTRT